MESEINIAHQDFWVTIKGFVEYGGKLLILKNPHIDKWDLPGGRIHADEIGIPFEETLRRELTEELGGCQIEIGEQFYVYKTYYPHLKRGILTIGYRCKFLGGEITLSKEHETYEWADRNSWQNYNFVQGHPEILAIYFS